MISLSGAFALSQKLEGPVVKGHHPVGIIQIPHAVQPDLRGLGAEVIQDELIGPQRSFVGKDGYPVLVNQIPAGINIGIVGGIQEAIGIGRVDVPLNRIGPADRSRQVSQAYLRRSTHQGEEVVMGGIGCLAGVRNPEVGNGQRIRK